MLAILKSSCLLLCAATIFSSCYTLSVYNRSQNAKDTGGNQAVAAGQPVPRNEVPVCSMRQLLKRFPAADAISWQKFTGKGWVACFTNAGVVCSMDFDANGDWNRVYQRFSQAPVDVREKITKAYSDYTIASVYGIMMPADETHSDYNVVIRNKERCKVLSLCKENIKVLTELDNAVEGSK